MLSLRDKIHSPAEALLKLTLMGRAPAGAAADCPITTSGAAPLIVDGFGRVRPSKFTEGAIMERAQYNRHSRARMAEMAKDGARHATPDAPERIDPRRRCTRHGHRTCCRGSRGSASLPWPRCENASKCATPDRAERVPTIGIDLIPYVDAHGRPPDRKTANWLRPGGLR